MGFHHVALATHDAAAIHDFYTEAMGFELVKTVVTETPTGGWSRHIFYDTPGGGGLMAFWDIHDDTIRTDFPVGMSDAVGLPWWVNHLAYDCDMDDLETAKKRWLAWGTEVLQVDHEFCVSIYTFDPDGNTVEWCADRRPFTPEEHTRALADLFADAPVIDEAKAPDGFFKPDTYNDKACRFPRA